MPLFLEPGQKYSIVLDSDATKPKESQPTFYAKSLPMRGQEKVAAALDAWTDQPDLTASQLFDTTISVLSDVVTGWNNMNGIEFSGDAMRDILTYQEARELLRKVMFNQHITADEKKSTE